MDKVDFSMFEKACAYFDPMGCITKNKFELDDEFLKNHTPSDVGVYGHVICCYSKEGYPYWEIEVSNPEVLNALFELIQEHVKLKAERDNLKERFSKAAYCSTMSVACETVTKQADEIKKLQAERDNLKEEVKFHAWDKTLEVMVEVISMNFDEHWLHVRLDDTEKNYKGYGERHSFKNEPEDRFILIKG